MFTNLVRRGNGGPFWGWAKYAIFPVLFLTSHHSGCVTGVVYSPLGHLLYSSSSMGSLALYSCQESHTPKLLRLVSNIMAKGEELGPRALTLNQDGSRLAFIGPHNFTITVLEAESLTEVLRVDITSVTTPTQTKPFADSARLVCFSPAALNQLLLITKQARLLKFSATNGELLSEVGHTHSSECSSAVASDNGRYLLTAGDQVIKVWDYAMALDLNFQVQYRSIELLFPFKNIIFFCKKNFLRYSLVTVGRSVRCCSLLMVVMSSAVVTLFSSGTF